MPDPQSLAKGLMSDEPAMRAYEPSWRDRMAAALMGDGRASPARAQVVMGLMGSRGLGPTGLSAVDATPAGAILDMQQAAQHGDKAGMAMAAAGFVPGAKMAEKVAAKVAEAAPAASKGIIAYHGSPHSFDRFDMSKIGTGEGAQSYGHGLYFAENEGVARSYRDILSPYKIDNVPANEISGARAKTSDDAFLASVLAHEKTPQNARFKLDRLNRLDLMEKLDELVAQNRVTPGGHMYEVKIAADPEHFLNWDKPLSEQPAAVREVFRDIPQAPDIPGKLAYYRMAGRKLQSPETSEFLRQAGIPGIKYLDQGSRGAGEGSRNYVVFDDKIIEIMRKYGLAGSAGAAMAAEILQRQNGGQPQGQAVAPAM